MIPGVSQFGGYIKNLAQNVRDVGTAVGTNVQIARFGGANAMQNKPLDVAGNRNIVNQVKEVAGAVLGKPGTRSDQYKPSVGYMPQGVQPTTKAKVAEPAAPTTTVPKPVAPKNTPMPKVEKPTPAPRTVT